MGKSFSWLTQEEIKRRALVSAESAKEVTREHWDQLFRAPAKELRRALNIDLVGYDGQWCGFCYRCAPVSPRQLGHNCRACNLWGPPYLNHHCCAEYLHARHAVSNWYYRTGGLWGLWRTWRFWRAWRKAAKVMLMKIEES